MPSQTYQCTLEVRGYELDGFGHVNHAMYISYLEHARWQMLKQEGITLQSFERWQRWPVIAHLEATYLKPTYLGDTLLIETRLEPAGRTGFVAHQTMSRDGVAVFKAQVRVVVVNESGRPAELPAEVSKLF